MLLAIGTVLAFTFLEGPWRWLALIPLAAIEIAEILLWLKLRKMKTITGKEALVGTKGQVVEDCEPEGQVRVRGQLWRATCREGAEAGDDVVVTRVDGLRLEVAPVGFGVRAPSSSGRAPDF